MNIVRNNITWTSAGTRKKFTKVPNNPILSDVMNVLMRVSKNISHIP
jgi:hypothetical protein